MSQSGIFPGNKSGYQQVPTPSGNNLSYFLNSNDGDRLYAKKSDGSVFPISADLNVKVSLTSDQVKTLNSIPVQATPNPGPGRAIIVTSFSANMQNVTIGWTSSILGITPNPGNNNDYWQLNPFLNFGINAFRQGAYQPSTDVIGNVPLMLEADADSLVGDGNIDVYIGYKIITL